ncbi:MAG: hypothetical protein ACPG4Q_11610 [Phycisphaeraceae bacterium]|mgnify:CR=1 FL=1
MSEHDKQLDQATRDRLAKLESTPVDLSRLEQKMADEIPRPQPARQQPRRAATQGWMRLAAAILLMIGIAGASYYAFFGVGPQTAIAETMTVAELHDHLLNDPQEAYLANTIDQAQSLIDAQLFGKQSLPIIDGTHVESCCLVEGEFPLRAALVLKQPGGIATIIIAQGEDFAQPMHPIDHPSGIELQGHDHAGMPMVMRNNGDLWMCVMGEIDADTLADVAAAIKFGELRE